MIKLTRLDGQEVLVNENYNEIIEAVPDTVVKLQNGHKLFVRETIDEICNAADKNRGLFSPRSINNENNQ